MNLEQELASIKAQLEQPNQVSEEEILENLDVIEKQAENYTESPEDTAKLLETMKVYRVRLGAAPSIKNARLVELIAENDFLVDQPTRDDRTFLQIVRDVLFAVDAKYLSWADSKVGRAVVYVSLAALVGWAIYPGVSERIQLKSEGYQACKVRVEAGLPCP